MEWVVTPGVWVVEAEWFHLGLVIGNADRKGAAITTSPRMSAVSDAVRAVLELLLSRTPLSRLHLTDHPAMEWVHRLWQARPVRVLSLLLQAVMAPEPLVVSNTVARQAHTLFPQDLELPQELMPL